MAVKVSTTIELQAPGFCIEIGDKFKGGKDGGCWDKLSGSFRTAYDDSRSSYFHIDLEDAKNLVELLNEYIKFKEGA